MTHAKKEIFSAVKAVKRNARNRVGAPRPAAVLPDDKTKQEHAASKHKMTLQKLLQREDER